MLTYTVPSKIMSVLIEGFSFFQSGNRFHHYAQVGRILIILLVYFKYNHLSQCCDSTESTLVVNSRSITPICCDNFNCEENVNRRASTVVELPKGTALLLC